MKEAKSDSVGSTRRKRVRITGVVQGVGFRPFVWKRANQLGLVGWVNNDSSGVTIELQGADWQIEEFLKGFAESVPPSSQIDAMTVTDVETDSASQFLIRDSLVQANHSTPISPEISICQDCLRELNDPANRRFQYPFINCTNCGPRFTIVEDIPYDRPLTTMKSFSMCHDCQREYDNPNDRRFHAQPNACPDCGPGVWFVADANDPRQFDSRIHDETGNQGAIRKFQQAIEHGQIVAVKGIGGFHLACDATNEQVVAKLRERKGRVDKPFAIMVRDVQNAKRFSIVTEPESRLLESKQRPIVLLQKNDAEGTNRLAAGVAPGNNLVGVMLPYSPMHYLLIGDVPLVFTSGNVADEPIARTNDQARQRLADLADCFLLHDRQISVVCDDSVVRCLEGALLPIRRSRGYAPMPVKLADSGPGVLAVGGEIKSSFCVTKGDYAYMSQHIGDMGNLETLDAMRRSVQHFLRLFRVDVTAVAADLHPGYLSGRWALEFANSLRVPLLRVQHHFAHVAGLMAEHDLPTDQPIIGCCLDGTGYGTDGAIWGGEWMIANRVTFDRFAHLKYIPLPGGDASIRRPYRVALAQLWASGQGWDSDLACVNACRSTELKLLRQQLEKNLNCVPTSSMGRLFDAIASLIGLRHAVNYEAQAAMELEAIAARVVDDVDPDAYEFSVRQTASVEIDSGGMIRQICRDIQSGREPSVIAAQFHHAVASLISNVCKLARHQYQINTVGLTGGVFQNVLLLRLTRQQLVNLGFRVLTHSVVPPNDGGLALGQAIVARNRLSD